MDDWVGSHARVTTCPTMAIAPILSFRQDFPWRRLQGGNGLLYLLYRLKNTDATDPRDKIYSLLGLLDISVEKISITYDASWQRVFTTTARQIIQCSSTLKILISAGSRKKGLPSWVPDWSDWNMDYIFDSFDRSIKILDTPVEPPLLGTLVIHSEESSGGTLDLAREVLFNGYSLGVVAHIVGTIDDVSFPLAMWVLEGTAELIELLSNKFRFLVGEYLSHPVWGSGVFAYAAAFINELSKRDHHWIDDKWCDFLDHQDTDFIIFWLRGILGLSSDPSDPVIGVACRKARWSLLNKYLIKVGLPRTSPLHLRKCGRTLNARSEPPLKLFGICRLKAKPRDTVAVIRGCPMPIILRKYGTREHYRLVGAAAIAGIMSGEVLDVIPKTNITIH